jgi:hypothetical protein
LKELAQEAFGTFPICFDEDFVKTCRRSGPRTSRRISIDFNNDSIMILNEISQETPGAFSIDVG